MQNWKAMLRSVAGVAVFAMLAVLMAGCGKKKSFSIEGEIDGFGTGNLRIVYYVGGAVRSFSMPVVDGQFAVTAPLDATTLARIYTSTGAPFGWLVVSPGDEIKFKAESADPLQATVEGSEPSARLYAFIAANLPAIKAADRGQLNAAAASYITVNPDNEESAVIFTDFFDASADPQRAAELLALIPEEVKAVAGAQALEELIAEAAAEPESLRVVDFKMFCSDDSLKSISFADSRATLLCYLDENNRSADSIITMLEDLHPADSLQIVEIGCEPDTAKWHRELKMFAHITTKRKLHKVERLWSPSPYNVEGLAEVAPRRIPWFVVADSASKVIYRGPSLSTALNALK